MVAGIKAHVRFGWRSFKEHWPAFLLAELAMFGAWVFLELAVIALHRLALPSVVELVGWFFLHAGFLLFFSGLLVGFHGMALEVVDGHSPKFSNLFRFLERGPSYFLALVLYGTAVGVGLLLFVAPGVWIAVRWLLFGQVLATRPASALAALREAGSIAQGTFWPLFRLLLLILIINVAGAALLGVGVLVSFPVTVLASASFSSERLKR